MFRNSAASPLLGAHDLVHVPPERRGAEVLRHHVGRVVGGVDLDELHVAPGRAPFAKAFVQAWFCWILLVWS